MTTAIKNSAKHNWKYPQIFCWLLAVTVFPLIWVGGLVTTTDAGMAVPDWPGTYGYNMFLYPWTTWLFGPFDLFVEHGHRLLGTLAGFISIVLVIVSFRVSPRWFIRLSVLALLLVIAQGALGGIRVLQADRWIAMIHGCVGPGFFAFVATLLVLSSKWFWEIGTKVDEVQKEWSRSIAFFFRSQIGRVRNLSILMLVASYLQLFVGANLRHVPADASPGFFRSLVWFHILLAVCIVCLAFYLFRWKLAINTKGISLGLNRVRYLVAFLVLLQFCLGLASWVLKFGFPEWMMDYQMAHHFLIQEKNHWQVQIVTGHVAVGSLIVASSAWMTVRTSKVYDLAQQVFLQKGETR